MVSTEFGTTNAGLLLFPYLLAVRAFAFEPVAERFEIAPFEAQLLALALASLDQVVEAARALDGRRATNGASPVALHSQLVLALPGHRQVREFVFDLIAHGLIAYAWSPETQSKGGARVQCLFPTGLIR